MLSGFISLEFLFFFASLLSVFRLVSKESRIVVLFFASLVFIGFLNPVFVFYGLFYTVINYFVGIVISYRKFRFYKLIYFLAQVSNIGVLVFFKYITIIVESFIPNFTLFTSNSFLLPLGISYYSFQSISYLYLIYKGSERAEKTFVHFGLYLLFFPKFIAGPIERSRAFFPQLNEPLNPGCSDFVKGARLFMWGALKKIVIANTLGVIVNKVYGTPTNFSALPISFALVLQSSYLYCDFSGYTDMALGLGRIFGIRLSPNFNNPLGSQSVGEFWRKWHISLSSWCNDFIYNQIMLRYRRYGRRAAILGIFATFLIIGVWHGANLTYLLLGLLQAIAIIYEFFSKPYRINFFSKFNPQWSRYFSILLVNVFFSFSLIFFFSKDLGAAFELLERLFTTPFSLSHGFGYNLNKSEFYFAVISLVVVYFVEFKGFHHRMFQALSGSILIRHSLYLVWLFLIVFFSKNQIVFTYAGF